MAAAMLLLLCAAPAGALPEALDPTFGSDGIVTTPIGGTGVTDTAVAMARDSNGKYVLAGGTGGGFSFGSGGDFALVRYNADGTLDTSFGGGDGKVTTSFVADQTKADEAWAVAIQPDGKIVAAGIADTADADVGDFAVVRFNTDGTPDTGFSDDGKATIDFVHDQANAVAIQGTKIVVAGSTSNGFGVARLNSNGTPDNTFDTDGKVTTELFSGGFSDEAHAMAAVSGDKIVAAGYAHPNADDGGRDFALVRYNDNGSLDTTFDGDGKVTTPISSHATFNDDEAHALAIQSDGKIVAAGESSAGSPNFFALARYSTDGSLDTGFGSGGKATTSIEGGSVAHAVALQADGKIVAAGRSDFCGSDCNFGLARYNTNGSLDTTFDGDGKVATGLAPDEQIDIARGLAIDGDGRAVVAGYADMGPPEFLDIDFAIVRHLPNGDNVPPALPTLTGTDPGSPSNDNSPLIRGTTDAGSTVRLYDDPSCADPPVGEGPAADFTTAGIEATVPSDDTTTLYARATDGSGNPSGCSTGSISYTEDSTPPAPPTFSGTDPPSPADDTTPRIMGTAEAGSTVKLYRASCGFAPDAQGTAAEFSSPGIEISVFNGSQTTLYATATDQAGNTSACSAPITYVEQNPQPPSNPPPGGSGPQPFPGFTGFPGPGVTGPGGTGEEDDGDPPRIAAPSGSAGTATLDRRGTFTVPRTRVRCAPDGGVCDVLASASSAGAVRLRAVRARRAKLTLGRALFTVEAGESSRVRIRLPRKARRVLRRLRRIRAVATITVTNLRETTASRTVKFTLRAPGRRR